MKSLLNPAVVALSVLLPLMADAQAPNFAQPQDFSVKPNVRSILEIPFTDIFVTQGSSQFQLYLGENGEAPMPSWIFPLYYLDHLIDDSPGSLCNYSGMDKRDARLPGPWWIFPL